MKRKELGEVAGISYFIIAIFGKMEILRLTYWLESVLLSIVK